MKAIGTVAVATPTKSYEVNSSRSGNVFKYKKPEQLTNSKKANEKNLSEKIRDLKKQNKDGNNALKLKNSYYEGSVAHANSLENNRLNKKNTSTELKQLKYSYKSVANKIMSAKTSQSAKQAVSQATREVSRLKKLREDDKYDSDELEAAIAHAKAMERVAKKKVKHLQAEEMAKIKQGSNVGQLEEKEVDETSEKEKTDEVAQEDEVLEEEELSKQIRDDLLLDTEYEMLDTPISMELEDVVSEMSESMEEMLSEVAESVEDLMSDLTSEMEFDIDPSDLKMMKIKHRNKEMKDIIKADMEYLKAVFDKLEGNSSKASPSSAPVAESAPVAQNAVATGGAAPVMTLDSVSTGEISIDVTI